VRTQSDEHVGFLWNVSSATIKRNARVKGQMFREDHIPYAHNASAERAHAPGTEAPRSYRSVKSEVRTAVTKARQAITGRTVNTDDAQAAVRAAVSELDIAAKKGVIHKNNASRRKSRLMKQLNKK